MVTNKQAAKAQAAKPKESGMYDYRFTGPVAHVFPDLGREFTPGQEFQSDVELHHFYIEVKNTSGTPHWEHTYQADPEILEGPEPELVEEG